MNNQDLSVLLVDDDPYSQEVFELVMQHHNLPFMIVDDAESALDYLKSNVPDIVVMDIFLPGLDGYQALDRIRRMAPMPRCRVIATTAYYTRDTEQEVLRRGFDGYVAKPFDKNLIEYLQTILNQQVNGTLRYRSVEYALEGYMMHDLSNWNVLIVDDEPDNRGVLEFVLTTYNAVVRTAASAQQCLQLMEERTPTLLLADIQMAGMSGIELLAKIREREDWRDLPVIAITAFAMPGDKERILGAGFNGYISKPLSVMELVDQLQELIAQKAESS